MAKAKISDFRPQQRNANRHTQRGLSMLDESMAKNGFIGAMTSARNGEVFDGSARLETAYDRFGEEVEPIVIDADGTRPIIVRRTDIPSADDPRAKKLAIAANRIAEVDLDWDPELLKAIGEDIDISDLFFDNELENLIEGFEEDAEREHKGLTDPDDLPDEDDVETRCKRGDIWQLGRHRLMCGDSTDIADVERLMNGKKADMVFTDPPYGVSYASKNAFLNKADKGNSIQTEIENDHLSLSETGQLWAETFKTWKGFLSDRSSYYIASPQGGDLFLMMMMMNENGFPLRHCLIWAKNNHVLGRCDYNYKHEPILFGWANTHKFYGEGSMKTSLWEVPKPLKNDLHPTMKPVELVENAILNSTLKKEIVSDFFLGSGTTLIACEKNDRICYGMELSEKYCDVILKRWEDFTGKTAELKAS